MEPSRTLPDKGGPARCNRNPQVADWARRTVDRQPTVAERYPRAPGQTILTGRRRCQSLLWSGFAHSEPSYLTRHLRWPWRFRQPRHGDANTRSAILLKAKP